MTGTALSRDEPVLAEALGAELHRVLEGIPVDLFHPGCPRTRLDGMPRLLGRIASPATATLRPAPLDSR